MRLLILFALAVFAILYGLSAVRRKKREQGRLVREDARQHEYRRNLFEWNFMRRLFAHRRHKQITYRPDDDPRG